MAVSDAPGFLDLIEPQKFTVGTSTVAVELSLSRADSPRYHLCGPRNRGSRS